MTEYVSPYVAAASARANYRSPLEMPIQVSAINLCPCCGKTPAMDMEFYGQICIHCDNDDCDELGELQAMGHTVKDAAELWNSRCDEYSAGKGGLK